MYILQAVFYTRYMPHCIFYCIIKYEFPDLIFIYARIAFLYIQLHFLYTSGLNDFQIRLND